jgi:hypothetical protein
MTITLDIISILIVWAIGSILLIRFCDFADPDDEE